MLIITTNPKLGQEEKMLLKKAKKEFKSKIIEKYGSLQNYEKTLFWRRLETLKNAVKA